jgi:hypothetical protein
MKTKNTRVSSEFIKLKHAINSCRNYRQLKSLSEKVVDHARSVPDERDILAEYWIKEGELIVN